MAEQFTTVMDVMRSIFPRGYYDYEGYKKRLAAAAKNRLPRRGRRSDFAHPPATAVDLFAIAGALLHRSGAYHHVAPDVPPVTPRAMTVRPEHRKAWVDAGLAWRGEGQKEIPAPPTELTDAWQALLNHRDAPIFLAIDTHDESPAWWWPTLALLCIADEAAKDIGFKSGRKKSAQASFIEMPLRLAIKRSTRPHIFTLSKADRDQICVLPKSRTPKVGCTIRSLSHNLALLPAKGLARAYWQLQPSETVGGEEDGTEPFNIIVLPTPYRIQASAFQGHPSTDGSWGWFEVEPHWCPRSDFSKAVDGTATYVKFIEDIIVKAEADVGRVHALVLPEVALSSQIFRALCDALEKRPHFELLISGLFDHGPLEGKVREGNFTAMARFTRGASNKTNVDISIREKHHRWRIERSQIETYALGSALDVNRGWWEHVDILSRSLDVLVLRGGATVTTLICEDLARSDPCQELVRGIGPNFVVALLMDGPQLRSRWPARYGTVLADDPDLPY